VKYSDFDIWNAITSKRCKIGGKLVLITNRKSYMGYQLVPKLTLNDLGRRNLPRHIVLLHGIFFLFCLVFVFIILYYLSR